VEGNDESWDVRARRRYLGTGGEAGPTSDVKPPIATRPHSSNG
jgi:hypothetical protein